MEKKLKMLPHPAILATLCGILVCITLRTLSQSRFPDPTNPSLITIGFSIPYTVFECIFTHRRWKLAQASSLKAKKLSPGRAVGFYFIPGFSLYWLFVDRINCARHFNDLVRRNGIHIDLVIAECILHTVAAFFAFFVGGLLIPVGHGRVSKGLVTITMITYGITFVGLIIRQINNFAFYRTAKELIKQQE